jgi:DNA-binding XRE family transcriptional regulator
LLFQLRNAGHDEFVAKPIGADNTRNSGTPRELFGLAITRLRMEKGESQATVAAGVGCQEFHLRNIEQGKENLTFDLMYAIIDYFGMLPMTRFWVFVESLAASTPG